MLLVVFQVASRRPGVQAATRLRPSTRVPGQSHVCLISPSPSCLQHPIFNLQPSNITLSSLLSFEFPSTIFFCVWMLNSNRTMAGSCSPEADNSFGPVIACPAIFDFTLLFEQSILAIGPSAIFLLVVPWRIWSLYTENIKTVANKAHWGKLVRRTFI